MEAGAREGMPPPAAPCREANETLNRLAYRAGRGYFAFICECNDPACLEPVPFTGEEYDRIIEDGHFLVAPGHNDSTREQVISDSPRFAVVARREAR